MANQPQSGKVPLTWGEVGNPGGDTTKSRSVAATIQFSPSFSRPPRIIAGISKCDYPSKVSRFEVAVPKVSEAGFELAHKTWGDSRVYSSEVSWLAFHTEPTGDALRTVQSNLDSAINYTDTLWNWFQSELLEMQNAVSLDDATPFWSPRFAGDVVITIVSLVAGVLTANPLVSLAIGMASYAGQDLWDEQHTDSGPPYADYNAILESARGIFARARSRLATLRSHTEHHWDTALDLQLPNAFPRGNLRYVSDLALVRMPANAGDEAEEFDRLLEEGLRRARHALWRLAVPRMFELQTDRGLLSNTIWASTEQGALKKARDAFSATNFYDDNPPGRLRFTTQPRSEGGFYAVVSKEFLTHKGRGGIRASTELARILFKNNRTSLVERPNAVAMRDEVFDHWGLSRKD
jgi:hypothetical protein